METYNNGKGNVKKIFTCSSQEILDFINKYSSIEAAERNTTQGRVIEEYVLSGIARNFPNQKPFVQEIYENRYGRYIDREIMLQVHEVESGENV